MGQTATLAKLAAAEQPVNGDAEQIRETAKLLLLDTIGVSLAGASFPVGKKIIAHTEATDSGNAAEVIGSRSRASASSAALANGTLASALDFDGAFHMPTFVVPAALAISGQARSTGAELLDAVIAGYEVAERLRRTLDAQRERGEGLTRRGWYHVGVVGPIASALTAGRLLGLSQEQLVQAVGLAASSSGGLRCNFGTMAKPYQAGLSASAGVQAAQLAAQDFTADPAVLETALGLRDAICLPGEVDWSFIDDAFVTPSVFEDSLRMKRFPACSPAHKPIDAMLELQAAHAIRAEDVAEIRAPANSFSLRRPSPEDEIQAGFSLPYLLAVALVDGAVGLEQVDSGRVFDPTVRAVMAKVRPVESSEQKSVDVELLDGTVVSVVETPQKRLVGRTDVVAKYRDCAARVLDDVDVRRLESDILSIETLADVTHLIGGEQPGGLERLDG